MPHDVTLIATIATGFFLAFVFGYLAHRVHLPPLIGYLLAGVAMSALASGAGVGENATLTAQLAEIGVMLLMFGVGLHFSAADLLAVRRLAVPGAVLQIVIATALGVGMARFWGWSFGAGLVLGLSLSVASTVVLLKALEERSAVATPNGRIAIGWLIVEDLAMVLTLVLLPAFATALGGQLPADAHGGGGLVASLINTLVKVTAFVLIVLFFGPRVLPWILRQVARTGSRELFTLGVLTLALGIAFGSARLFDVSYALGAFFAGVVLSESELSHKAAANSLPLQDAFAVLFFVSVGMVFDPHVLLDHPAKVLGVLALIMVGKSFVALVLVVGMGYPLGTALTAGAALAQVGEFSFILAGLGITYKLLPPEGLSLVLAGAMLSITLNPVAFALTDGIGGWLGKSPRGKRWLEEGRGLQFARIQAELDATRLRLERKSAAHQTFTPGELVNRFPLFAGLTAEQREVLLLHFETRRAQPGERVIRSGEKADSVYFISAGEVEVVPRGGENRASKIKLGPGSFFGEMALLTGDPRSADVTALDFSKFLTLSRRDFRRFLKKHPSMRAQIVELAAERGAMNRALLEQSLADTDPPVTAR